MATPTKDSVGYLLDFDNLWLFSRAPVDGESDRIETKTTTRFRLAETVLKIDGWEYH